MKKIFRFLFNKIIFTTILIMLQIAWLILFFVKLSEYSVWISITFSAVSVAMFLAVIVSNQNPAYQIGWITIIAVFPILGGMFYLFMGNKRPSAKMKRLLMASRHLTSGLVNGNEDLLEELPKRTAMTSNYIYETVGYPISKNTHITYYDIGEKMYQAMLEDLENAEKFIFFEYFIVSKGEMWSSLKKSLKQKAMEGLDVRIILDDFGCIKAMSKNEKEELVSSGIKLFMFNPIRPVASLVMNHRDHRKITVIDGKIGYTGGINIADEYINRISRFGHWKDTGVRLEGEGVRNLTLMFLRLYYAYNKADDDIEGFLNVDYSQYRDTQQGFVQAFSDSPLDDESTALNLYLDLLWNAQKYAYIFTPYLVIDNELQSALCFAAKRGVDVRIVVPGIPDKKTVMQLTKSYFKQLILSGVKIYRYTPGFIHAKNFLVDDYIGVVGTINLDYRSLYLHFECGVLMMDNPALYDVKKDFEQTFEQSAEVKLDDYNRNKLEYIIRAVLRLISPLF